MIGNTAKALIIDDDHLSIQHLTDALGDYCQEISLIDSCESPLEGIKSLQSASYDIVFLDIEMPQLSAFELIDLVGANNCPPIVFTTAYSSYAVQAFRVRAIDYLLKPIDEKELQEAVKKALASNDTTATQKSLEELVQNPPKGFDDRLSLVSGQEYHFVKLLDILRIEGAGSYVHFHLLNGKKITNSKGMIYYEERLAHRGFIRSHQSHMANLQYVQCYSKANGGELMLANNQVIPVSPRRKQQVQSSLGVK